MIQYAIAFATALCLSATASFQRPVDPPVDWRGISYVLGGVIVFMGSVIAKLYFDCKAKDREIIRVRAEHEQYLKDLLRDLRP